MSWLVVVVFRRCAFCPGDTDTLLAVGTGFPMGEQFGKVWLLGLSGTERHVVVVLRAVRQRQGGQGRVG